MSEAGPRLRLQKLWKKKNRSESNFSHLGQELEQSEQVCLSPPIMSSSESYSLIPQHSPTPSLQPRPGFLKKVTGLFKHPEAVYLACVDGQSITLTDITSGTLPQTATL